MTTCRGQHHLEVIYRDGPEMEQIMVRWCVKCGAITIDIDVDSRTQPGGYMKMRLPLVEQAKQGAPHVQV